MNLTEELNRQKSLMLLHEEDYRGEHQAPNKSDSPMYDLSGTYPDDIYGYDAARMYGHYGDYRDNDSIYIIQSAKGKPNKQIRVYRAVPYQKTNTEEINSLEKEQAYILRYGLKKYNKTYSNYLTYDDLESKIQELKSVADVQPEKFGINNGDWVSISREYTKDHGDSNLNRQYKVISKVVPAKNLYTDGNSIHEWGYYA